MVQSLIAFMDHMGGRDQGSVYIHYIIFSQYINVCMIDSSPYLSNSSIVIISFIMFHVYCSNFISYFFMIYLSIKNKNKKSDCHDIYKYIYIYIYIYPFKDRLVNDMLHML